MPESPSTPVPRRRLSSWRRELAGLGIIFLTVVAVYCYIGIPPLYRVRFLVDDGDYYNQLADGLAAGRLGFKKDPPAALTALKDPYDPVQRVAAGNVGAHDATYFKGRYYLYFGVAPALVLFLPFELLAGVHFPQNLATVLFCAGGFAGSLALLFGLRRREFPTLGTGWVWGAAVMLGLGNFCAPMLARNSVWELPIAGAYCFSMTGFWFVLRGLDPGRSRALWFGLASTAFGLAVASRPHFVFVAGLLAALWAWWRWRSWLRNRREGERWQPVVREAAAVLLPLGLIVLGLLVYNYARFENPFEFGQKYQLAGNRQVDSKLVGWRFFPANAYVNFIAPAQLDRYFPFFQMIRGYPGTRPADYGGAEDPYGVFANLPATWLVLGLLAWRLTPCRRRWLAMIGGSFLVLGLAVSCFAWSANRYEVDFIPCLLLLAMLGLLQLGSGPFAGFGRGLAATVTAALIAYTAAFNLLVAIQHNDLFKTYRPQTYARLAAWLNQPALWWERSHPAAYGPVQMEVRFPRDQLGKAEPLAVTGLSYKSDFVYVLYYPNTRQVRLAFNHTGGAQWLTPPITVDFAATHRIGITAGSFYPGPSHPFFSGRPAAEVAAAKRTLRVDLDGIPYLAGETDFYEASPGFVTFGENHVSDYIGRKFTGEVLRLQRGAAASAPLLEPFAGEGFLQLAFRPRATQAAFREPLVMTGEAGRRDLLFLDHPEGGSDSVRFGLWHEGEEPVLGPSVALHPGETQVVEASLGSFYPHPADSRERELAQTLVVRLNGQTFWVLSHAFHPAGTQPPVIGRSEGAPGYAAEFSGDVVARHRVRPFAAAPLSPFVLPPYWLETESAAGNGAMRIHFELPAQRPTKVEPFVVTGASALLADYVTINHITPDRVTFAYVHAGAGGPQSARFPVETGKEQLAEIDIPSLYPAEGADYFATRTLPEIAALRRPRARLKLNGRVLFDTPVPAFDSPPDRADVGADRLVQAFGPRFTGRIVAVERETLQPPAGLVENHGPLELKVIFPRTPLAAAETLLATGAEGRMDSLMIVYGKTGRAHLEVRGPGAPALVGGEFSLDAAAHVLRVEWGGLHPAEASSPEEQTRQRNVKIFLDSVPVCAGIRDFVRASPQTMNIGGAGQNDGFSGRLQAVRRLP